MRAAWLWAGADLRRRWVSHLLLAVLVALVVGAVLALAAGARRAGSGFDRWAAATDIPDVLVSTGPEPTELLSAVADDPRIARVEHAGMIVAAPAPMEPGPTGFTVVGSASSMTGGFGRPLLVAGRYADVSSSDEVVVNERAAATHGFKLGQRALLQTIDCYEGCPAKPVGEVTIVGIVRLPTDLIADPQTSGIAFASPAFLDGRWRGLLQPFSWLGIHLRSRADTDAVVADLSVMVPDGDAASARATMAPLDRAGQWQLNTLVIAAAIVGLIGSLVVVQALTRHLAGRSSDPPVLAAMGVTRRERSVAGLLSVAPAVIGGIAGGVALAVALSPLFPLGVIRRADPDVGLHADTVTLTLGGVAALTVLLGLASLVAARWAMPSTPRVTVQAPSIVARLTAAAGRRPVPATGMQFALAPGHGRTRLPVVATVCALAGVVAVVAGALVVRWSIDGLVGNGDRSGQSHDLLVGLGDDDAQARARQLAADPRVRALAISRQGGVNLAGGDGTILQVAVTGVENITGPAPLAVLAGRAPAGPGEIALASATMATLALDVGDHTTASGPCGEFEVEVVGRVIVPLTGSNYPDDGSILTLDAFDELCAADNVASTDVNTSALVRLGDRDTTMAVRDEWRTRGIYVLDPETPNSVGLIRELRAVPLFVATFVGVLGAAAAAHALVLTVRRRQRDFAVLRALGLRPIEAANIVRWQAITLAAVALVVGIPLGLVVGRMAWTAIAAPSNVVVRIDVHALGLAVLVAGVTAIAAAAAIWPARQAARLQPAAALGSE